MKVVKIFYLIILCLFTASFLNALTVEVINMIPWTLSGETNQDSQPDLTVSPVQPMCIVAGVLTPNPGGAGYAPIFRSINGGMTWSLRPIVPSTNGKTKGITVAFGSGPVLYAAIINDCDEPDGLMQILRTDNFNILAPMTVLRSRQNIQQPYIRAGFPPSGNDAIYVGYNNLNSIPGNPMTAYIEYSLDADDPPPANLTTTSIEFRDTGLQDGPAVRPAIHPLGTIYSVYVQWLDFDLDIGSSVNGVATGNLIVVRDDNWGDTDPGFHYLIETIDSTPGKIVEQDIQVRWLEDGLGQERLKDRLSIAVDPNSGQQGTSYFNQIVYVAYADISDDSESESTLHVCRSLDSGESWTLDLLVVDNAINPQLAVNANGVVAFLYQVLNTETGNQVWETRLEYSFNLGNIWQPPIVLSRTPANVPDRVEYPYLGDYAALTAVGPFFYGAFSANNTPDLDNFPDVDTVTYQRNHDFGTNSLCDTLSNPVDISIDPFFFKVNPEQEYYIRDWTLGFGDHDLGEEPSIQWIVWETSDVWNQPNINPPLFLFDIPLNGDPVEGMENYAYARVHRNNAFAAETVTLDFYVSEFGVGNPFELKGSIPLTFAQNEFLKTTNPGLPWVLNYTDSIHLCLGVEMSAPGDNYINPSLNGLAPGPPTDVEIRLDNNKAQRNMKVHHICIIEDIIVEDIFYAVVHNWSTITEDISLKVEPGDIFLEVYREPMIRVIGGSENTYRDGKLTLYDMKPGENRWIELSLPESVNKISREELIPVRFSRVKNRNIVDGFTFAVKRGDLKTRLQETMSFHASVFFRLYYLIGTDYAMTMSKAARELVDHSRNLESAYAPYCSQYAAGMREIMYKVLDVNYAVDFFGLEEACYKFLNQINTGDPNYIQPAHSIFLNKLDACLTMIDKKRGDIADILLNVYWQRSLYQKLKPLQNYESTQKIIENSSVFITDYSEKKAAAKDFPQFLGNLMDSFQDTAYILSPMQIDLSEEIIAMGDSMESPMALQKAHRDFLLKLAAIDVTTSALGDVNDDGMINMIDALLVAQYYVGLDPSPFFPERADVNCDGKIEIIDALLIAQYYVGLISKFC